MPEKLTVSEYCRDGAMRPSRASSCSGRVLRAGALVLLVGAAPALAALRSVSGVPDPGVDPTRLTEVIPGGPKENVAYSLANGFPLWYRDESGLTLELCLDQWIELATTTVHPCLTAEPFPAAPISFPANFGAEAVWWSAATFGAFTSLIDGVPVAGGEALFFAAQEAGFAADLIADGNQASRGRIHVHFEPAFVPSLMGSYLVTHPYGSAVYEVNDFFSVQQRHDVGNLIDLLHAVVPPSGPPPAGPPPTGDFTLALTNGPDPAFVALPPDFPAVDAGIVSSVATGIGPFLVPLDPAERIFAPNGGVYLSNPGTELAPRMVPVTGSPFGTNFFRIELLNPPPGVYLNAGDPARGIAPSNVLEFDLFQVTGKIFDGGDNLPPQANDDAVHTPPGAPIVIDVIANDADPVGPGNVHGLNPQALGLPLDPDPLGTILLTRSLLTAGGTVQRFTEFTTGWTTFVYTPNPGFTGVDTFRYVVQDRGGLVSAPATVTVSVSVEDLAIASADYRGRTGKWRIAGTSTDASDNTVLLFGGPRASLAAVPPASGAARGSVGLRLTPGGIEFQLALDPLPGTTVTEAHLHVGAPGQEGPLAFDLYDGLAEPAFTGTKRGTLTAVHLHPGVESFAAAVAAILAGDAYVDVHTAANAGGELRGQLAMPLIGAAPVDGTGKWAFSGKAPASPGGAATVSARSSNGVWTHAPLRYR
jgi:hypothetical protein